MYNSYTLTRKRVDKMETIRTINAYILIPFMLITGFRFSKSYRHAHVGFKHVVYACVDTVTANIQTDRLTK